MKRLTYGVFATIIKMCCNGYQPNKANRIVPQKKLNGTLLKAVNSNYDVMDDDHLATTLFACDKGLPRDILDYASQVDHAVVANYFRREISQLVDPNKRQIIINTIKAIIKEDNTIKSDTIICKGNNLTKQQVINKNSLEFFDFISGVFIYCITTTINTDGKNTVSQITFEYLSSFEEFEEDYDTQNQKNEMLFTRSKLNIKEIISRLSAINIKSRISMWESLSDISNDQIFSNKEFCAFFADRIADPSTSVKELIVMFEMMGSTRGNYKKAIANNIDFISFLVHSDDVVRLETIKMVAMCKIQERDLIDFLVSFLKNTTACDSANREFERYVVNYFCCVNINLKVHKEDIIYYCKKKLEQDISNEEAIQLIALLCIQLQNDTAIKYIKDLSITSNKMKENVILALAWFGEEDIWNEKACCVFYIKSPRLKAWLKDFIFEALQNDDDIRNSNLIYALMMTEIFPFIITNSEFWMAISSLDDYSLEATLERLNEDLNPEYFFNKDVDINGLKSLLQRHNLKITEFVLDILAQLNNKTALDVLVENSYVPQYYNVDFIILNLIENTNIKQYRTFYLSTRSICLDSNYVDKTELLMIAVADYIIGDINELELIKQMQVTLEDVDFETRHCKRILQRLCIIFNGKFKVGKDNNLLNAIAQFTKTNKPYTMYKKENDFDEF